VWQVLAGIVICIIVDVEEEKHTCLYPQHLLDAPGTEPFS